MSNICNAFFFTQPFFLPAGLTITEKQELLTVPDIVDAIWARIESQVDIDMPADYGALNPSPNPPAGTGSWNGVIMTIFIAALVEIFILPTINRHLQVILYLHLRKNLKSEMFCCPAR